MAHRQVARNDKIRIAFNVFVVIKKAPALRMDGSLFQVNES